MEIIRLTRERHRNSDDFGGQRVTLNVKKMPFLQIDDLYMSFSTPTAVIPLGRGDSFYSKIRRLVDEGVLMPGVVKQPEEPKDPLLDELDSVKDPTKVWPILGRALKAVNPWSGPGRYGTVLKFFEHELFGQARSEILEKISEALDKVDGPRPITMKSEATIRFSKVDRTNDKIIDADANCGDEPLDL